MTNYESTNRSVLMCTWSRDNTLSDCVSSGAVITGKAAGLVTYTGTTSSYMYIAGDPQFNLQSQLTRCTISLVDVTLSSCVDARPATGVPLSFVRGMVFNGNTLYMVNSESEDKMALLVCQVDPATGVISPCQNTGVTPTLLGEFPKMIAINGIYLYMTAALNDLIYQCPLANLTPGGPSSCTITSADETNLINQPFGITFKDEMAYIVSSQNNRIVRCPVNAITGNLGPACDFTDGV